jgi:lysophospholipase L1-like esterase
MAFRSNVLLTIGLACAASIVGCSSSSNDGEVAPAVGAQSGAGGTASLGESGSAAGTSDGQGGTSAAGGSAGGSLGGAAGEGGSNPGGGGSVGGSGGGAGMGSSTEVPLDASLLSKCTGANPIVCALTAPNGNYDVTVEVGDASGAASSQVAAETRHYAGPSVPTTAGMFASVSFTANVRQEQHDGGQSAPANVLDLSISGSSPKLHGLGFRPAPSSITIFVAGDSTVCDWVATNTSAGAPDQAGWAQELSMYLKPGIAVANYADSGETAGGFYTKFFPPARTAMKAGDYLFIQFGHNDQKNAADITNYKANLTKYVTDARAKNVTPVIFTPVSRSGGSAANPGFAGLEQQASDLATQLGVALVDLTTLSRAYYTTVPDKNALFIDGTHFHEVGAIGVAGVVAQALKTSSLPLKSLVK